MAAPATLAADAQGRYAIKGVGASTCAEYNEKRRAEAPETYMYLGWFQGWLSNENRATQNTFDLAAWQHTATLLVALDAYCRSHPEHLFVTAAESLIAAMGPDCLQTHSLLVEAEAGGRKVTLYAATLLLLQQRLGEAGLYSGSPDGRFDPQTREAIRAYQKREGLPLTSLPDQVVLQRLVHRRCTRTE